MKCSIHPENDAVGACTECGGLYCSDDFLHLQDRRKICRSCATERLSEKSVNRSDSRLVAPGVVIVQQQQQQESSPVTPVLLYDARPTNGGRIALWIVSVLLIISGLGNIGGKNDQIFGAVLLLVGIVLLPPVMDRIRGKNKSAEENERKEGEAA